MARARSMRSGLVQILSSASVPVYIVDDQRCVVYINAAGANWVARTADELFGLECRYCTSRDFLGDEGIGGGLCPPPEAFLGQIQYTTIAAPSGESGMKRRRATCLPLGDREESCAGVVVVLASRDMIDTDESPETEVSEALELHERVREFRREECRRYDFGRIIGQSPVMRRVREQIRLAASSRAGILIVGPPGSGRRHIARTIHYGHPQTMDSPLVTLDCELLDVELIGATLNASFGPGNSSVHEGPSDLLLLNVEQLSLDVQDRLIELIQRSDSQLRLIGTSRHSLLDVARELPFRAVLSHALSTLTIEIPPLVDHREDIPILVQHLIEENNSKGGRQLTGMTSEAMDRLVAHRWPGHISELFEIVGQACQRADGPMVTSSDLPDTLRLAEEAMAFPRPTEEMIELDRFLSEIESELIRRAVGHAKGNKAHAARLLGISRPRLLRRMDYFGLGVR